MLSLPQHIASNVVKGIDPKRGAGFQTLAVSEELMGTEDLRVLEEMAPYYQASRADRQTGRLPVRELYYRLPSGNYAVTRIEDWGIDPHGRAGNSLAHSLVVPSDSAVNSRWDPLELLDHLVTTRATELPEPGTVPPLEIAELPAAAPVAAPKVDSIWLSGLIGKLFREGTGGRRPVLSISPPMEMRALIRTLEWTLPLEERNELTFATHFYRDCHIHRERFRLTTIDATGEAPLDEDAYYLDNWNTHGRTTPISAFTLKLASDICDGNWRAAQTFRDWVDEIRRGAPVSLPDGLTSDGDALVEATGTRMASALLGKPALIARLLNSDRPNRELAEALLSTGGPKQVTGDTFDLASGTEALRALERVAGKQAWREWSQRWANELPEGAAAGKRPWWALWKH